MIVEIRPGEGGEDAELFAAELALKIASWLSQEGFKVTLDPSNEPRLLTITSEKPVPAPT